MVNGFGAVAITLKKIGHSARVIKTLWLMLGIINATDANDVSGLTIKEKIRTA